MKSVKTLVALTATAVLSAGAASAAVQNIVTNGDFETGDFTGWTDFLSPDASIESTSPFEGTFNAKVDNTTQASGALIKGANFGAGTLVAGAAVEVRFWARGSAGVGGVHFAQLFSEVAGGGVSKDEFINGGPLFPASDTVWQEYVLVSTLGADVSGGVTLQFNAVTGAVDGSTSTLEIDDVRIFTEVVPEPGSLALLGLGGLALLRRRRAA